MKRPTEKAREHLLLGRVLIIVALLPLILTGFMSMPGEQKNTTAVDIEALMKRVMKLNKQKEHEKAIEVLLQVVDEHKDDSILRTLLVQSFDLFLEEEIKDSQKAIQINPSDIKAYNRLVGALELVGDNFRAMEMALSGVHYDVKATDLWMKIGRLELKASRPREALDVFKEVIRLDPKNSDAYNNAAYILAKDITCGAQELQEAEAFAKNAHKLDPKNAEYIDTLAEVHFRQGNIKMAQTLIEEAIKLAPEKEAFKFQLKKFKTDSSLIPR